MFSDEDKIKYRQFRKIVDNCDLNLKGEAVVAAALIFDWFYKLEKKINNQLQMDKARAEIQKQLDEKEKEEQEKEEMNGV